MDSSGEAVEEADQFFRSIFVAFALAFFALLIPITCSAASQKVELRSVVILSKNFIAAYGSEAAAQKAVLKQNALLNESFERQSIPLVNIAVAFEVEDLGKNDVNPHDLAMVFEGDDHLLIERDQNLANITKHRLSHKADIVILMTNHKSPIFAEGLNYGVCASFDPEVRQDDSLHPLESDPALIIVDNLGLNFLTFQHEFGHALGLNHHEYAQIDRAQATLMITNGNPQKWKRLNYWSDNSFRVQGRPLVPLVGQDDVSQIRANLSRLGETFESWSRRK